MKHHTKDKGDAGVGFVVADMLKAGIQPAMLLSEHLPFDCIAIAPDAKLARVQVKYRSARSGFIAVKMTSCWADKHGVHSRHADKSMIDAVAVYCPDTATVYYVKTSEISDNVDNFTLRLEPSKNGQKSGIRMASDFVGAERLFA